MIWTLFETPLGKEREAYREITALGHEVFMPLGIRKVRLRGAVLIRRPVVLPGYIFGHMPLSSVPGAIACRHVEGVLRNDMQGVYAIPDSQMVAFMASHADWLSRQERLFAEGKRKSSGQRKREKFKLDPSNYRAVMARLFEADPETGELAA